MLPVTSNANLVAGVYVKVLNMTVRLDLCNFAKL